ncbi:MAG: toll/interleukin-1 receptor domain-containing protein [Hyphomonadaceae bacterium]|nr:toll/interleukin-1 receptor domain-containing protein [Hyphomonadaceae bacterium]
MTVFIAHAEADRPAAEALGKFLERRGLFVELENGERGFRPVQRADTVVALWSKDAVFSPHRLSFEKRTLEAWADEQLVLIKLDHAFSPVGLRDLAAIDASFEAQRDIAWAAVAKTAQDARVRAPAAAAPGAPSAPAPAGAGAPQRRAAPAKAGPNPFLLVLLPLTLLLIGAALALLASNPDLLARLPANAYQGVLPVGGALLALVLIGFVLMAQRGRRSAPSAAKAASPAPAPAGEPLFVSYAHADNMAVVPVVEAVQAEGRSVWLDRGANGGGIAAGEGWAGEIVRAIKGARGVIVMCSAQAFESDHVKREVYLADRYKKPMLPVFLEAAAPPEDFEYFFAGVQWLELHKTPESERASAIARALKAV